MQISLLEYANSSMGLEIDIPFRLLIINIIRSGPGAMYIISLVNNTLRSLDISRTYQCCYSYVFVIQILVSHDLNNIVELKQQLLLP